MTMTRAEHLKWAKDRALEYVTQGDLPQAFASLVSDLRKHPDLEDHLGMELGMQMILIGDLNSERKMRDFIEGFN